MIYHWKSGAYCTVIDELKAKSVRVKTTYKMEEKPVTTKEKVKQMKGWENLPDELAEQIAKTVRKFAELFYITIAREMSLAPLPVKEEGIIIPLLPEEQVKQKAA